MNTRALRLRRRAALAWVAAYGLSGALQQALAAGNQPQPPGLRRLRGTVTVNGQPAREGLLVNPGDTVETGAGGEAVLVMGRNAFLQRENSRVSFGADVAAGLLRVVSGKLMAVFPPGTPQRLETATATIGIRGTGCYIEVMPERTYFCLCYGKADVTPTADAAQVREIVTNYHNLPYYIYPPGSPEVWRPEPVVNHSDAELSLLEGLVGRQPPFSPGASGYGGTGSGGGGGYQR